MQFQEPPIKSRRSRMNSAILPAVVGGALGLVGLGVGLHGLNQAEHMARTQTAAASSVKSMEQQVNMLTHRINQQEARERELSSQLAAAQTAHDSPAPQSTTPQTAMPASSLDSQAAAERPAARITAPAPAKKRRVVQEEPKKPVEDPRIGELEKKFDEHARRFSEQDGKLADNQRMIETTRTDLENQLGVKSGELAGSIAKTSEEVAELRKRGERDYFEFDLTKSKQAQRVGPLSLALRKADTKHKRYNLDMIVDDNKLEKKNVNLLEPVYVTASDRPQPLEVVVNRIDKDRVTGYISVPKYKRSELTSVETGRSTLTLPAEASPER